MASDQTMMQVIAQTAVEATKVAISAVRKIESTDEHDKKNTTNAKNEWAQHLIGRHQISVMS